VCLRYSLSDIGAIPDACFRSISAHLHILAFAALFLFIRTGIGYHWCAIHLNEFSLCNQTGIIPVQMEYFFKVSEMPEQNKPELFSMH